MKKITLLFVMLAIASLAGCDYLPFGFTSIKDIVAAPANFEGKEVKIRGKVKTITKIPLIDFKMFVLEDESAQINVITKEPLPAINDTVTVKGTVEATAVIGGQSVGLRVNESKRLPDLHMEIKVGDKK